MPNYFIIKKIIIFTNDIFFKKHLCEYFLIMRDNGDIPGFMKFELGFKGRNNKTWVSSILHHIYITR